jgi:hypothetical protein
MRSLPEIISDMRDISKLLRSRQSVGMSEAELLTTIEMLAIDVQHLAKHVSDTKAVVEDCKRFLVI